MNPTDTANALRALVEAAVCEVLYEDGFYPREETITAAARRIAALATAQPEAKPEGVSYAVLLDDLAMLVRKLARDLTKAKPDADLPAKALDYLDRKGLHARILRGAADHSSTHHVHRGPESLPCYCPATMDHGIGEEATRQAQGGGEES